MSTRQLRTRALALPPTLALAPALALAVGPYQLLRSLFIPPIGVLQFLDGMPNPNPHPEQFQDGVRWFQSLLLLAPLFGTSLRVPYPLVVGAQLCASLLSMHIFVHASRFEAYDGMDDDTTDATFAPLFYGNASSQQLSLYKPSTSSSMRVTLCAAATSAAKYAPPKLRCRATDASPSQHAGHTTHAC